MAALISALDNKIVMQIGENGHQEYGWSHSSTREGILQFSFQLTRTEDAGQLKLLDTKIREILSSISSPPRTAEKEEFLITLYKMIGHTRDVIAGKGEYSLTYMMILAWYDYFPECAKYALEACVCPQMDAATNKYINDDHPYGSWKDIKYFCNYCKQYTKDQNHPMIMHAISLMNRQILIDHFPESSNKSLAAKWVPRENSGKFGWMFKELACQYNSHYLHTSNKPEAKIRAIKKAKMDYRKLCAELNKIIDTTQIKQCSKKWSDIDFDRVTSITLTKQKKAFLNVNSDGELKSDEHDRMECRAHFMEHVAKAIVGEKEVKGARIGMENFTKQAMALLRQRKKPSPSLQVEEDMLNSQWRDNGSNNKALGAMIAMVDVSSSMTADNAMNAAIALGCRIAENSLLGKRVMTFSADPTWVNLEGATNFIDMVDTICDAPWGMDTNFYSALDMILESIVENQLAADVVENMMLVILSDMQMNQCGGHNIGSVYEIMEKKYAAAGIRANGIAYKPPHILFWNLRSTNGFPSSSTQKNVSMVSGFNPSLLNMFCEQGLDALQSCTPWSNLMAILDNDRYTRMQDYICNVFRKKL